MWLFLREIYWTYICLYHTAAVLGELLALLLCDEALGFCSSLVFVFGLFGHWRAVSRRQRRLDSRVLQDNTDATWSLHHQRDIASITLPITCLSACPSIIVQLRDSLHRIARSGRYLYLERPFCISLCTREQSWAVGLRAPFLWKISSKQVRPLMY